MKIVEGEAGDVEHRVETSRSTSVDQSHRTNAQKWGFRVRPEVELVVMGYALYAGQRVINVAVTARERKW